MSQPKNERFQNSDLKIAVERVMRDYQGALANQPLPSALSTGYADLDQKLDGLRPGLHVLAGRSQMGKTTLMLNIADHLCFEQKVPSLIFSMELRVAEIMRRMLFSKSFLDPFYRDRNPNPVSKADLLRLTETAKKIAASRLFIEENISFSVDDLINTARQHKEENHIGFVAVDNLQLLRSDPLGPKSSLKAETLDVVSKLKRLALELSIPILLIVNIPRKPSSRRKELVRGLPQAHHIKHHDAIDGYFDTITTQGKRILFCEDLLEVFVVPSCAFYSAFDSSAVCGLPTNQVHR